MVALGSIDRKDYADPPGLTEAQILEWFNAGEALWMHEGDPSPKRPHAELTSGLCSNGYFDVPRLLSFPHIAELLARQLAWLLQQESEIGILPSSASWVVSSAYSAITFGHEVAKALNARFANVEKDPTDPDQKKMLWRRLAIPGGSRVLQIEELITTMGTTAEVRRAVEKGNPHSITFLPIVGTLVLRPPKLLTNYGDRKVVALIQKEIWAKHPQECPLCAVGSPRLKPKTHWAELTQR